ncbi:sugar transferase [Lachnospiraceae bacterium ZAX-1]
MGKKEQYKRLLNYAASLWILAVETFMFGYMWYTYYVVIMENMDRGFYRRGNWAVIGMYTLIVFLFTRAFGGYSIGYLRIADVCLSQVLALFASNVVGYLQIQITIASDQYLPVRPILQLTTAELVVILPSIFIIRYLFTRLYPPRKMIVIYGEYSPQDLIEKINSRKDRYDICATESVKVGYEMLYTRIMEYEAVLLCDLPSEIRNQILKFCFDQKKMTYMTPKLSDIIITGAEKVHLFDTPLMLARNQGLTIEQRIVKRMVDIVLSIAAIIITSPMFLLIAACIKGYDKGPVFYTQERVTVDGKRFQIIKFRSMRVDSETEGARLARKRDERITPIGNILRRIHFDEFPQIFNILKGEMSFVGPRPERAQIAEEYESIIPEFGFRLKVKAGLTGYAQIYGKYNTTPYDKLKLDLTYVENYSVLLDLKLLLMTVKIVFQGENTEGVEHSQKTAVKEK